MATVFTFSVTLTQCRIYFHHLTQLLGFIGVVYPLTFKWFLLCLLQKSETHFGLHTKIIGARAARSGHTTCALIVSD